MSREILTKYRTKVIEDSIRKNKGKRILLDIHDMDEWIEKNKTRFID